MHPFDRHENDQIARGVGRHDLRVERPVFEEFRHRGPTLWRVDEAARWRFAERVHERVVLPVLDQDQISIDRAKFTPLALAAGADANEVANRVPALNEAARRGTADQVAMLLKAGATVAVAAGHPTPLHEAAKSHKDPTAIIDLLVGAGSALEAQDAEKLTPLLVAAKEGNIEAIKALVSHRARLDAVDGCGKSPLWRFIEERGSANRSRRCRLRSSSWPPVLR